MLLMVEMVVMVVMVDLHTSAASHQHILHRNATLNNISSSSISSSSTDEECKRQRRSPKAPIEGIALAALRCTRHAASNHKH